MVGIWSKIDKDVFCGGTIIHFQYILSASHCFVQDYGVTKNIYARVGDWKTNMVGETIYEDNYGILKIIKHPQYNPTTYENDIALLQTDRPILFSRGVGPACLPLKFE